ncbi:hypothetical protein GCM10027447_12550 [Glycomyces halotolerans]
MTETTCQRDGRPVADGAYCCAACVDQTETNLAWVAEMASELETTLTRQDRVSAGTGGRASAETPLPVNLHASDVGHRLRNTLTTWVRRVVDGRGSTIEEAFPAPNPSAGPICRRASETWCAHSSCRAIVLAPHRQIPLADIARYLQARLGWIAHRDWGPRAFDEISRVAVDLGRAVDSPPPMISLGQCDTDGCSGHIRAHQEASFARCPECRESYDVARRKDALMARADHLTFTAISIARILTAATGQELKVQNVYNWVHRQKLRARGKDANGRPVYPLGVARSLHQQAIMNEVKQAAARDAPAGSEAA